MQCELNSLFGRVVELVLVGAAETLLDPHVRPEPLHGGQQLLGERLGVFHPLDHVEHHLRVRLQHEKLHLVNEICSYIDKMTCTIVVMLGKRIAPKTAPCGTPSSQESALKSKTKAMLEKSTFQIDKIACTNIKR